MTLDPRPLLNVNEVAARLGVSVKTIWRMRVTGDFPQPLTIGRRSKRWRPEDVEAYVEGKAREAR